MIIAHDTIGINIINGILKKMSYQDVTIGTRTTRIVIKGHELLLKETEDTIKLRYEYDIGMALNTLNLSNFVQMVAWIEQPPALIEQYVNGVSLGEFVEQEHPIDFLQYSLLLQIYLAILIAHEKLGFAHNDLHDGNVLVTATDEEFLTYEYHGEFYKIETGGYLAVIIDFGEAQLSMERNNDLGNLLPGRWYGLFGDYVTRTSETQFLEKLIALEAKSRTKFYSDN